MKKLLMPLMLAAFTLSGCATAYQAKGLSGGYTEQRRSDFVYVVRFEGNGYTSAQQTEDMALLRAAELTTEKGFKYLTLLNESTDASRSSFTTPSNTTIRGNVDSLGNYRARTRTTGGETFDVTTHTSRLLVGMAPTDEVKGYVWLEAASIIADLRPKLIKK